MDATTGKELYQERLHSARYRASPVFADGKIYLTARDGVVSVVKAGPEFELLATNELPDAFTASPAVANGRLYLRDQDGKPLRGWFFQAAFPSQWSVDPFAAERNSVAIEKIELAYAASTRKL